MEKFFFGFVLAIIIVGCNSKKPIYANVRVVDETVNYAPTLDVFMQENILSINVLLDGTSVYDTSYTLSEEEANGVYKKLEDMDVNVYSDETPEWRNKQATQWKKENNVYLSNLMDLLSTIDSHYAELYWRLDQAATNLSKPNVMPDGKSIEYDEKLDTLKAD